MPSFSQLRQRAILKRDNAIKAARAQCKAELDRIKYLERKLGDKLIQRKPRPPKPKRALGDLIQEVLPHDRTFTIAEVVAMLKRANPRRVFQEPTVRALFQQFNERGIVRRVRRGKRCVLWAAADFVTPDSEFGAENFTVVAERILRERGPLTPAELVVTAKERGYRADADPRVLLDSLLSVLRHNPGRFKRGKAGRWVVV